MGKLTKAQREALSAPLFEHFDVWGGYWWTHSEDGGGRRFSERTIDALRFDHSALDLGKTTRVSSGRQVRPLLITPAGRAALEAGRPTT